MNSKFLFIILAIFFNAFANIFMKYGVKKNSVEISGIKQLIFSYLNNPLLLVGIAFFGIALIFYSKALEKFNLSIAYPLMTSSGILIVTLWSLIFFGEKIGFYQLAGLIMITGGIWLLNIQ